MYSWRILALFGWIFTSSFTAAQPTTTPTSTAAVPQSTACGDIVNSGNFLFPASLVYECLNSVPFNPAVATRFLSYWNDTIQFQSTLAYLKDPPSSYQQQGVDLVAGLNQLQEAIDEGKFPNQYQFEAALAHLLYAAHDYHLYLDAGVLAVFTFASPRDLISVSKDGVSEPKIYFADDLFDSSYFTTFQPSAIKEINGVDSVTYLEQFAANNSFGTLEPNADWNQLMLSPVLDILGYYDVFSGNAQFYPGDTVTFALENDTTITDDFLGLYYNQGPTGPLETGGDFYNFFVLGYYPAGFDPYDDSGDDSGDTTSSSAAPTPTSSQPVSVTPTPTPSSVPGWDNSAYPTVPDVYQPDLATTGGGFLSGYFLKSSSIAILSIPDFDEYGDATHTFQDTVQRFINEAKAAGMTKVVIDVQGNSGGQVLLALDAFMRFFPKVDTFAGSRMRAHNSANVMGITETDLTNGLPMNNSDYGDLIANEWVVTARINAETGESFSSWAEYYGPNTYHNDNFTNVQRYNVSNVLFDDDSSGNNFSSIASIPKRAPPFAARDIIILTDGTCGSSCSLFVESMHHDAGVRVVAVGGRPKAGPMQGAAGTRGARLYELDVLDDNIDFVQQVLQDGQNSAEANFLPNRTIANDVFILDASINLRDQVRRGQTTPLQFTYVPADCRIYFTPQTVYNYTNLWTYAANAIWNDTTLCVAGSTGLSDSDGSQSSNTTNTKSSLYSLNLDIANIPGDLPVPGDLTDTNLARRGSTKSLPKCSASLVNKPCPGNNSVCQQTKQCSSAAEAYLCVPTCSGINSRCDGVIGSGTCRAYQKLSNQNVGSQSRFQGLCNVDTLPACKTTFSSGLVAPAPQPKL
ncbi:hypothetical protein F5Y16DRAFT_401888 [Xylariaceae sp. FL0255]|nr:hypothetical protein F5Y16DRAFT_401888 [Xylariaceae sp. FL0255]